jgi:hypothetical protein
MNSGYTLKYHARTSVRMYYYNCCAATGSAAMYFCGLAIRLFYRRANILCSMSHLIAAVYCLIVFVGVVATQANFKDVRNIEGGITAYAAQVDPSVIKST